MSIEFRKLNSRPGVSGSFGSRKTSGVSSQATKNLANASTANSTIKFSLKNTKKSGWVAGQNVSRGKNQFNYQGTRKALNGSFTPARTYSAPAVAETTTFTVNNNTAYQKGMIFGQILNGTFSLLNEFGVFDKLKGEDTVQTNSQKLDAAILTGSSSGIDTSSDISSYISNMEGATDSTTLRSALSEANGQLSTLNSQTSVYQDAQAQAKSKTDGYGKAEESALKNVATTKGALGTANETVKATEGNRNNCLNAVSKADAEYGKAVSAYTQAHDAHTTAKANYQTAQNTTARAQTSLNQAKATLANTPEYIDGANGVKVKNPAYEPAKAAVENAEAQLEQAKKAEAQAKEKMDQAADAENKALQAKEDAYKNLGDKKEAVDAAESKLKEAQEKLDTAKKAAGKAQDNYNAAQETYQQAQTILASNESIIEKCKAHAKSVENLSKAIEKQQERLSKLEEKEIDKYEKYDEKAQKGIDKNETRNEKINYEDGVNTFRERRLSKKMERTNENVEENLNKRNAYSTSVSETQYIKEQLDNGPIDFTSGGQKYRHITTPGGNEVYYKDNQLISEEEYKIAAQGVSA